MALPRACIPGKAGCRRSPNNTASFALTSLASASPGRRPTVITASIAIRALSPPRSIRSSSNVVLGGNSLGGQIAWATALTFPERVERLILVDSAGYAFRSESVPIAFRIARLPGINRLMENILPRSMVEASVKNVYGNPDAVTPALVDRYYDLARREGNRHALAQRFEQNKPGQMAERIPTLRLPVLILWGARDRLIPLKNGQQFNQDIAGSQLQVFEDLGHVPQEEDPQRTVQAVAKFIAVTR